MKRNAIPVSEYTTPFPITAEKHYTLSHIKELMDHNQVHQIPVVVDGHPLGIITEQELATTTFCPEALDDAAWLHMKNITVIVNSQTRIDDVVLELVEQKVGYAIITDGNGIVSGIFTVTDALSALIDSLKGDLYTDPRHLLISSQ